jgi:Uma2 family endonuclease
MQTSQITVHDRFTVDQFRRMIAAGVFEADQNIELIEGKIIAVPPQGPRHAARTRRLLKILLAQGFTLDEVLHENPVLLNNDSECVPDITLVECNSADPEFEREHPVPEQLLLVIEVSDTTLTFDLLTKSRLYAAAGIREYWVVDLNNRQLFVHAVPENGQYTRTETLIAGAGNQVALPGGKVLGIDELFAR